MFVLRVYLKAINGTISDHYARHVLGNIKQSPIYTDLIYLICHNNNAKYTHQYIVYININLEYIYRQTSNISLAKSPNLNVSRLVL